MLEKIRKRWQSAWAAHTASVLPAKAFYRITFHIRAASHILNIKHENVDENLWKPYLIRLKHKIYLLELSFLGLLSWDNPFKIGPCHIHKDVSKEATGTNVWASICNIRSKVTLRIQRKKLSSDRRREKICFNTVLYLLL